MKKRFATSGPPPIEVAPVCVPPPRHTQHSVKYSRRAEKRGDWEGAWSLEVLCRAAEPGRIDAVQTATVYPSLAIFDTPFAGLSILAVSYEVPHHPVRGIGGVARSAAMRHGWQVVEI